LVAELALPINRKKEEYADESFVVPSFERVELRREREAWELVDVLNLPLNF